MNGRTEVAAALQDWMSRVTPEPTGYMPETGVQYPHTRAVEVVVAASQVVEVPQVVNQPAGV